MSKRNFYSLPSQPWSGGGHLEWLLSFHLHPCPLIVVHLVKLCFTNCWVSGLHIFSTSPDFKLILLMFEFMNSETKGRGNPMNIYDFHCIFLLVLDGEQPITTKIPICSLYQWKTLQSKYTYLCNICKLQKFISAIKKVSHNFQNSETPFFLFSVLLRLLFKTELLPLSNYNFKA